MDKRWHQLAEILVNYSTRVQPGERVMIAMKETHTLPLVRAVYEAVVKAGGLPQVQFLSDYLDHAMMRHGTPQQIATLPGIEAYGMEWADVYLGLRGAHNLYETADVPAATLSAFRRTMGIISTARWEKTRWCLVRVPDESFAQQAETDHEAMMDLFFDATLQDWAALGRDWQQIADRLNQGKTIRIVGSRTDLRFSVEGRRWFAGDGRINMPDGEIYTAPVERTVDGHIHFDVPGVLGGRLVPGIYLEWRNGELVEASAESSEDFLRGVLATDDGASRIGEFAFGTNYAIDRFSKDILIDEKIGGTIHIALGRAYPECGGTNQSALHWDIIKDLRTEGVVTLDGKAVFEQGAFRFEP
jgi:aminopeptidase